MGYLHEGHLELMRRARERCDFVVASIFVNPTSLAQRGPGPYPRDLERDARLAEEVGVDVIFNPSVQEMYPPGYCTYVEVGGLRKKCAALPGRATFGGWPLW